MMSFYPIVCIQLSFVQFQLYVPSFVFYQKENVRAFITILGVTMKSETEQNAFVEKLAVFFS